MGCFYICFTYFGSDGYIDYYIDDEIIKNRTGSWYFGVWSIALTKTWRPADGKSCKDNTITKDLLDKDFHTEKYTFVAYTGGAYYFNTTTEVWEGVGLNVTNTDKEVTWFTSNHLTSFGTGFTPQINNIDFKFIFSRASFSDNMTIYVSDFKTYLLALLLPFLI